MDASQLTPEQRKELEEKVKSMSPEQLAVLQKQQCIFCQIVSSKIPAKRIYEDERMIVILDINPAAKGHLLLVPKEHYAIMPQVKEADLAHFVIVAKLLSQVLLRILRVTGTNIFVANGLAAGQRSSHFLIHVIPRKEGDGLLAVAEKLLERDMIEKIHTALTPAIAKAFGKAADEKGKQKHPVEVESHERVFTREPGLGGSVAEQEDHEDLVEALREKIPVAKEVKKLAVKKTPKKKEKVMQEKEEDDSDDEEQSVPVSSNSKSKDNVSLDDIANLFK